MASMISEHESFQGVDGKPIVNGYIYVGAAGQDPKLNPIVIYSDRELTTPIANPQRTDSYGRAQNKIWVTDRYSLKVEDSNGVQKLQDLQRGDLPDSPTINLINVQGINDVTADAVPPVSAYVDKAVYVLTVVNSNTGAVTLDFGGGAKSVIKNNGDELVAGDWPAGSVQRVSYNAFSGRFDMLTFSTVEINEKIALFESTIIPIGFPFPVFDHIPGCPAPSNAGVAKYIKLTAGQSGAGQYNEGLLTDETVTGMAPDVIATAVIALTGSPVNGQIVSLINTERRIVRPGASGELQGDAIRNITGNFGGTMSSSTASGAFAQSIVGQFGAAGAGRYGDVSYDASRVVPTADENRMKNIGATYYMRIA